MEALSLTQIESLGKQVLLLGFALAVALGWLVQRSHFCTMGAISDWVLMRDATRLRQWGLALAVAMLGLGAMTLAGWLSPLNTIYAAPRFPWLSYLLGGLLFGVGMVLASGCPTKNLVRLGTGNLKSLVVLLVMGMAALATLRGWPGLLRVRLLDPITTGVESGPFIGQWLASVTGLGVAQGLFAVALLVSLPLLVWVLRGPDFWRANNLLAGVGVGAVLLALWWVSGMLGLVPEHPETLERVYLGTASGRMEGLSFTGPLAQWLDAFLYQADGARRITLGMALVPGVVLGAALSAWRHGDLRWEGFTRPADLVRHLVGALFMGIGGVSAMGCSFGQGLTGLSTLNWGSLVAVASIVAGAGLALRVQWWLAERHG
jgi:uncharacterized membrane protein YedE/YeeE